MSNLELFFRTVLMSFGICSFSLLLGCILYKIFQVVKSSVNHKITNSVVDIVINTLLLILTSSIVVLLILFSLNVLIGGK